MSSKPEQVGDNQTPGVSHLRHLVDRVVARPSPVELARALVDAVAVGPPDGPAWNQVWLVDGTELRLAAESALAPAGMERSLAIGGSSVLASRVRDGGAAFAPFRVEDFGCAPDELAPGATSMGAVVPLASGPARLGLLVAVYPGRDDLEEWEQQNLLGLATEVSEALAHLRGLELQATLAKTNQFVAESAQILAEASSFADTLDRLARLALTALGDICLIDVIGDDGRVERMVAIHRDPGLQALVDRLGQQYAPDPAGEHPAVAVMQSGATSWSAQVTDAFLLATTRNQQHYELVKTLGFRAYISVPLLSAGEILGSLTLVSASRSFESADVSFTEHLARQVAAVVFNARRYDATLRTSHILQQSLLPQRLPTMPGLEVETRYLPSTRGLEVGGDFYDLIVLPSGRAGFMIGDVAGHDRDAAAAMGQLRSAARALSGQVHSPAALVDVIQWSWDLLGLDRIATAVFGRLDHKEGQAHGTLILATAGHPPPLLVSPDGASYLPLVPSPPLGAPGATADNWEGRMERGQVLLLYTDGVFDERAEDASISLDRLVDVVTSGPVRAADVCDRVVASLPARRLDDVALMALGLVG